MKQRWNAPSGLNPLKAGQEFGEFTVKFTAGDKTCLNPLKAGQEFGERTKHHQPAKQPSLNPLKAGQEFGVSATWTSSANASRKSQSP